jgi:hypothetical protein
MANVILPATANGRSVTISTLSQDWTYSSHLTSGRMLVKEILFCPGAAGEKLVIKSETDEGQVISQLYSVDGSYQKDPLNSGVELYNPMIDVSECSVASGTARVIIRYRAV